MNAETKGFRACEGCRNLKVQCEPDETGRTTSCRRCAKAHRECIVIPSSRKRQKKPSSRIEDLEKKIDALTASLHAKKGQHPPESRAGPAESRAGPDLYDLLSRGSLEGSPYSPQAPSSASSGRKRKMSESTRYSPVSNRRNLQALDQTLSSMPIQAAAFAQPSYLLSKTAEPALGEPGYIDVIDRNIIDLATAASIFDRYKNEMSEVLPIVRFPPTITITDIRRTKPILFLAVLYIASGTIRPELQTLFGTEVYNTIANRIVCRGDKSLELVQTLQVITIWYQPMDSFEALNFNQLMHMAAVMGIDIGMGKRTKTPQLVLWRDYMSSKKSHPDPNSADMRRAWIGCYYMCTCASMSLRHPQLVRWTPYMDECLEILATSPDALLSDRYLSHLVRAQHIAEDVAFQFSMDDPATRILITDTKTQYHMTAFENQLRKWRNNVAKDSLETSLIEHTDAIISLYMHEIALRYNHTIDNMGPAYTLTERDMSPEPDFVTPAHIESISTSIDSIHKAFDAFLSFGVENARNLPTPIIGRTSYAAVALMKVYSALSAKNSKFGGVFSSKDLKIDHYLDTIVAFLQQIAEGNKSPVAQTFIVVFGMLKTWHSKKTNGKWKDKVAQEAAMIVDAGKFDHMSVQEALETSNATRDSNELLAVAARTATDWNPVNQFWGQSIGNEMMNISGVGPSIDTFGFTLDEFNALGNLMEEDPSWLNFDLDAGAWLS